MPLCYNGIMNEVVTVLGDFEWQFRTLNVLDITPLVIPVFRPQFILIRTS